MLSGKVEVGPVTKVNLFYNGRQMSSLYHLYPARTIFTERPPTMVELQLLQSIDFGGSSGKVLCRYEEEHLALVSCFLCCLA